MPSIVVNNNVFYSRGSGATREHEYENAILSESERLFPNLRLFKTKPYLSNGIEVKRPDMLYIAKDYSFWGFIEIELAHHSIDDHIIPQIEVISTCSFPSSMAHKFCTDNGVSLTNFQSLIKYEKPTNFIIINRQVDELVKKAKVYDFSVSVLEIFESINGERAVRLNGADFPVSNPDLSHSISQTYKKDILKCTSLDTSIDHIIFNGSIYDCEVVFKSGVQWIIIKNFNISIEGDLRLHMSASGHWMILGGYSNVGN